MVAALVARAVAVKAEAREAVAWVAVRVVARVVARVAARACRHRVGAAGDAGHRRERGDTH